MLTTLSKIIVILAAIAAIANFPQTTIAQPNTEHLTKQVKPTPYRANYERAIAKGIIRRPSGVPDESTAIKLADEAIAKGNKNEAAVRLAQALVIISERTPQGTANATALERSLDADVRARHKQSLRAYLPLFGRIFPVNKRP
jgi:NaMN:DMB phosphoribosyltransferase